jgi:hypothetical protein
MGRRSHDGKCQAALLRDIPLPSFEGHTPPLRFEAHWVGLSLQASCVQRRCSTRPLSPEMLAYARAGSWQAHEANDLHARAQPITQGFDGVKRALYLIVPNQSAGTLPVITDGRDRCSNQRSLRSVHCFEHLKARQRRKSASNPVQADIAAHMLSSHGIPSERWSFQQPRISRGGRTGGAADLARRAAPVCRRRGCPSIRCMPLQSHYGSAGQESAYCG